MGIYKVIQIKLPKTIQNSKKQYKKKTYQSKKSSHFFEKKKTKPNSFKRKKQISLQQTAVIIFLLVLFAKGISLWQIPSKQEIENTTTQANFFLRDSLPY